MDQKENAGHHRITRDAVDRLFDERAEDVDGRDRQAYADALDEGQEHADRVIGGDTWKPHWMDEDAQRRHAMADPNMSGEENLEAIREFVTDKMDEAHAARTALRDFDRLDADQDGHLTSEELATGMDARSRESSEGLQDRMSDIEELSNDEWGDENDGATRADLETAEMRALGAAVHSTQDSYSNAHMFRDTSDPSDPTSPVEGINVFDPLDDETQGSALGGAAVGAAAGAIFGGPIGALAGGALGGLIGAGLEIAFGDDQGTHDHRFDEVDVDGGELSRPGDLAAVAASAELLGTYYDHAYDSDLDAHAAHRDQVDTFFQGSDSGVEVYDDNDDWNWGQERDERL